MRRTMRLTRGAVLAATLALPGLTAGAEDGPAPTWPYPSSQQPMGPGPGGASSQTGAAPGGFGEAGAPAISVTPGGAPVGPVGPDGTPISGPGQGAGSGAFAGGAGGAGGDAGFAPGLGGSLGGAGDSGAPPGIIGDFPPISKAMVVGTPHPAASTSFPNLPNPTPPNPPRGGNPGIVSPNGTTSILYKLTGLKIADNQSPRPQDRFFYSFNYFDNLNASVNRQLGSPVQNLQVYHQLFGFEKTFLDGRASIGFRLPLNTISLKNTANVQGLPTNSTAMGDLSIFLKYALYTDERGNLISGGLQVTAPTGPGAFGGNKYYSYFRDTQIQPFVGFIFARDRFYVQGFSSVNVPTMSQDVTLYFNDIGVGYYVYRADDPRRFVTAIVPTAEAHLTTPLNHRGFSNTDLASTPDILNMTFGTNVEFRRRAILTAAYVTPVTGPKPFNAELVLLLNIKFGGSARSRLPGFPTQ
jgi:hypothetical protein